MDNIEEFKRNCIKLFTDEILYELKPFEEERQKKYKECLKYVILFCIVLLINIIFLTCLSIIKVPKDQEVFYQIGLYADFLFTVWLFMKPFWIAKDFENEIKKQIMPSVFKNVKDFKWQEKSDISTNLLRRFELFDKIQVREDDDCFKGEYKDVEFDICESSLKESGRTPAYFKGVLVCLNLKDSSYKGFTLIKQGRINQWKRNLYKPISDLNKKDIQQVHLEDVDFEKRFNAYSTDQVEARYLLTTAFMERFKNLAFVFNADKIEASFSGNYVLIAIYTRKDLFKLGNITKPVYNFNQFKTMIDEFVSILELIDELKLNQNIGM